MAHVSAEKKATVKEFVGLIKQYPIIAAVNMENLPAKQLQNMRAQLRGKVELRMTKRRLIAKAFEQAEKEKPGITKLTPYLKGMPALLFTDQNPFTLFKLLKKNKSKAPIKSGQKAPHDIIVPAGPTGFAPGPIISELASFGIKSGIQDGKVAVKADSVVAKEGQVVSFGLASILTRLGIEPMEVGLDLSAVYENGGILTKQILDVDEEVFKKTLVEAHLAAVNLSYNAAIPTKDTASLLIRGAAADALVLAMEVGFLADDTAKIIIARAAAQAAAIASQLPDEALSEEARQAKSAAPATHAHAESLAEKKAEKKEEKQVDTAAGLGALFG